MIFFIIKRVFVFSALNFRTIIGLFTSTHEKLKFVEETSNIAIPSYGFLIKPLRVIQPYILDIHGHHSAKIWDTVYATEKKVLGIMIGIAT